MTRGAAESAPAPRPAVFAAAAAACGAAVTIVEFAALRRLAPWFGQSVFTWANDVGVVLLFLAVGSTLGGALADRAKTTLGFYRALQWGAFWLVMAATMATGVVPSLLAPSIDEARGPLPIGFWESLAAAALCFGPPMLALGMVAPFYVRRATHLGDAGRAAGRIAAWSTVGSLVGCYVAPFWLLPELGTRTTLLVAAGLVGAVVLWGYLSDRRLLERPAEPDVDVGHAPPLALPLLASFAVGAVVLVVEFASVRLFAPWFGQSNPVWANAVGVVMLSLALGYAVGGRRADRGGVDRALAGLLGVAALLVTAASLAGPALAAWLAPTDAAGDRALALSFWGSLVATTLLVGPPVALLGAATPLLVRAASSPTHRGRAAGRVFAAGTIGSLAGTYAAPLALIPSLGSRRTLLACALALAALAAAVVARARPRPRRAVVAAALAATAALALWVAGPRTLRTDAGQVVEVETSYQTVRVVEDPVQRLRYLGFDEDVTSYQSLLSLDPQADGLTGGRYYDHLALGAWFQGMPWTRSPASAPRVLVIGYAGGTVHRVLDAVAPAGAQAIVHGVELDPGVVALARSHLRLSDLETSRLTLIDDEDGRAVVESLDRDPPYDLILVDAYQRTQYVPFQLATEEFFRACAERLAPGGAIGMNVMAEGGMASRLVGALAATLRTGLSPAESIAADTGRGRVFLIPNPWSAGSVTVWGTRGLVPRLAGKAPLGLYHAAYALDLALVRHVATGVEFVLTDDRAPTEGLADEALLPGPNPGSR